MRGDRQLSAVDFNQIPFVEAVMEVLSAPPTTSPTSGPVPVGRFFYSSTDQVAYVSTPVGWKSMNGVQKKVYKIGDGSSSTFVIGHNFNSQDLMVSVRLTDSPFSLVSIDVDFTDLNNITLSCDEATPLGMDYLTVIIMG